MTGITVEATLQADGKTLRLEKKLDLPPGRISVTLLSAGPNTGETMLEALDRIHREQLQRGRQPMAEEEMAAEIAKMRAEDDEYEECWKQVGLQAGQPQRKDK
jgi:hypothetical protein